MIVARSTGARQTKTVCSSADSLDWDLTAEDLQSELSFAGGDIRISQAVLGYRSDVGPEALAVWLATLLAAEFQDGGPVAIALLADTEVADLNRQFRGCDTATDVLSFPGDPTAPESVLGDIAISLDTAARQAQEQEHSLHTELKYLILHGLIHCLGHDHDSDDGEMNRLELSLRDRWLIQSGRTSGDRPS